MGNYRTDAQTEAATIESINSDLMGVYARIEHELGAHPNYTWAQTSVSTIVTSLNAVAKEAKESATFSGGHEPPATTPEYEAALKAHNEAVERHGSAIDEAEQARMGIVGSDKPTPYLKG